MDVDPATLSLLGNPNSAPTPPTPTPGPAHLTPSTTGTPTVVRRPLDQAQLEVFAATDDAGASWQIVTFAAQALADGIRTADGRLYNASGALYVPQVVTKANPEQPIPASAPFPGYFPVSSWGASTIVRAALSPNTAPPNTDPLDWSTAATAFWRPDGADPRTYVGGGLVLAGGLAIGFGPDVRWWHRTLPVTRNGRTEIWHTTLLPGDGHAALAHAFTSGEFSGLQIDGEPPVDAGNALDPDQRAELVVLTGTTAFATPATSILVEQAVLSGLGATARLSADVHGVWNADQTQHLHDVIAGYGNLPVYHYPGNQKLGDPLMTWSSTVHLGREMSTHVTAQGNLWPFGHRITVGTTFGREPDGTGLAVESVLDTTTSIIDRTVSLATAPNQPFVRAVIVDATIALGQQVTLRACDRTGNWTQFSTTASDMAESSITRSVEPVSGHVDWTGDPTGAGRFRVTRLTFESGTDSAGVAHPNVTNADVVHPALRALGAGSDPVTIVPSPTDGDVYATIVSPAGGRTVSTTAGPTHRLGALAALDLVPDRLSRATGAVPNLGPDQSIKLFNLFDLASVVGIPIVRTTNGVTTLQVTADHGTVAPPKDAPGGANSALTATAELSGLDLTTTIGDRRTVTAQANSITLALTAGKDATGIRLTMAAVDFTATDAAKPSLTCELSEPTFTGALEFLNPVLAFLPGNLFSNPPAVTIDANGAHVDYDLALPAASLGVFDLSGLGVEAGLSLPFDGTSPQFTFDFPGAGRHFDVAVDGLGGTGSFALDVARDGVSVDASIGFGGIFSLSLLVVSGGVQITGGVHLHRDATDGDTDIGGYLDVSGWVEALDVASVSIGAHVEIDYDLATHAFTGTGSFHVSIDVLFVHISKDVGFSVTLAGTGSLGSSNAIGDDAVRLDPGGHALVPPGPPPVTSVPVTVAPTISLPTISMAPTAFPIRQAPVIPSPAMPPRRFSETITVPQWQDYAAAFASGASS